MANQPRELIDQNSYTELPAKYDRLFKAIWTGGWGSGRDSGDVESSTGAFARFILTEQELTELIEAFQDEWNEILEDDAVKRETVVGTFGLVQDSNGLIWVFKFKSQSVLDRW